MKICETCGKELKFFDVFTTNGIVQCEECAMKTLSEKSKKRGNTSAYTNLPKASVVNTESRQQLEVKTIVDNSSNFWIHLMKTMTVIELIASFIASIVFAFMVTYSSDNILLGFGAFLGLIIISLVAVGFQMIFFKLAEDVSILKNAVLKIVEKDN